MSDYAREQEEGRERNRRKEEERKQHLRSEKQAAEEARRRQQEALQDEMREDRERRSAEEQRQRADQNRKEQEAERRRQDEKNEQREAQTSKLEQLDRQKRRRTDDARGQHEEQMSMMIENGNKEAALHAVVTATMIEGHRQRMNAQEQVSNARLQMITQLEQVEIANHQHQRQVGLTHSLQALQDKVRIHDERARDVQHALQVMTKLQESGKKIEARRREIATEELEKFEKERLDIVQESQKLSYRMTRAQHDLPKENYESARKCLTALQGNCAPAGNMLTSLANRELPRAEDVEAFKKDVENLRETSESIPALTTASDLQMSLQGSFDRLALGD